MEEAEEGRARCGGTRQKAKTMLTCVKELIKYLLRRNLELQCFYLTALM